MTTYAFRVVQHGNDLERGEIVRRHRVIADYPATLTGARKALAAADYASYGQEPGRIAPRGRGYVYALADGAMIRLRNSDDPDATFQIEPADLDPHSVDGYGRATKSALFAALMLRIRRHHGEIES